MAKVVSYTNWQENTSILYGSLWNGGILKYSLQQQQKGANQSSDILVSKENCTVKF